MANKNLFLIHGAWATKCAFNYLTKTALDIGNVARIRCFEYDCQVEPMDTIVTRAYYELKGTSSNDLETIVIGHSLGGLIALSLSEVRSVKKTITVAAPLAGLKLPKIVQLFVGYHTPVIKHLIPGSKFLQSVHKKEYMNTRIECIVASQGFNPVIYERNDGVITYESQTKWHPPEAKVTYSYTNHHEVLQSAELIRSLEKELTYY